jgi:iron complex outermembrane receptor protein
VATSIQSFGGKQGRLSLGTRFRSGLEVLASGTLFRSAGQDLYYPELNDSSTNFGRAVNMDRDRRDHALLKVTQGALTLVSNYSSREKRIPTATFGTTFNDPAERTHDDELMLALQFSPLVGERGQLHTALSYNSKTFDGYYPVTGGLGHNYSSGRWWIAEGNYAVRLGRAHQMVLGGEYQLNARQSQGIADALSGTTYFSDNTRADNWGVFGQDEIRLTPRVLVNAGLRYDHYASFGGTLNPRLALIYHHAGSAVKLLAGRAFRAPNNNEQYFAISQAQKTNPNLTPEEIWSYEGVVDHQLGRRWRVSLSAYQNRIRRLITLEIDPADSLRVFRNVGSVDARGFEIETGGDLGGLDLRLSYGLQRTRYPGTATKLANSPQHLGKVDISHALLHEHLTVGGEMLAVSRRIASNGGPVPGHAVFNLTLRSQQWPARVSAGLAVYNLLGTRYSDPASKDQIQTAIPQDGRSLRATLQYGF